MFSRFTSHLFIASLFIFFLGGSSYLQVVHAEEVYFPLDPVCCFRKYPVYGEDGYLSKGDTAFDTDTGQYTGDCQVSVNMDKVQTGDDAPTEVDYKKQGFLEEGLENIPKGFETLGFGLVQSLASPFTALYNLLPAKVSLPAVIKEHAVQYQTFLDEKVFGNAIALIAEQKSSKDLGENLEKMKDCKPGNPKPSCVIDLALCSYEKYSQVLFYQSGQQAIDELGSSQGDLTGLAEDTKQILVLLQQRDQALLQEMRDAQEALDTAIMIYSQLYQTYFLHLRFKDVIVSLVKVRNITSSLHQLVACLPNKFVGVATTKCN